MASRLQNQNFFYFFKIILYRFGLNLYRKQCSKVRVHILAARCTYFESCAPGVCKFF